MENEPYKVGKNEDCFDWSKTEQQKAAAKIISEEVERINGETMPQFGRRQHFAALDEKIRVMLQNHEFDIDETTLNVKIQASAFWGLAPRQ